LVNGLFSLQEDTSTAAEIGADECQHLNEQQSKHIDKQWLSALMSA
jgi:hypothetical protein